MFDAGAQPVVQLTCRAPVSVEDGSHQCLVVRICQLEGESSVPCSWQLSYLEPSDPSFGGSEWLADQHRTLYLGEWPHPDRSVGARSLALHSFAATIFQVKPEGSELAVPFFQARSKTST